MSKSICYRCKSKLIGGEILSANLMDINQNTILHKGDEITPEIISSLKENADINLVPIVPDDKAVKLNPSKACSLLMNRHYIYYFRNEVFKDVKKYINIYIDKSEISLNIIADIVEDTLKRLLNDDLIIYEINIISAYRGNIYEHSISTAVFSTIVSIMSGLKEEELLKIAKASLFCDTGKFHIFNSVLHKANDLTDKEMKEIKNYTRYGYAFMKHFKDFEYDTLQSILMMRERWDGRGYPNEMKEDEIHKFAQILSISSYYTALTSSKLYRDKIDPYSAATMLIDEAGKSFNKELVAKTINIIGYYDVGMIVKLRNGETARVVRKNRFKPTVKILSSSSIEGYEINLQENTGINIKSVII